MIRGFCVVDPRFLLSLVCGDELLLVQIFIIFVRKKKKVDVQLHEVKPTDSEKKCIYVFWSVTVN